MTMTKSEHTRYIQSSRWEARAAKYRRHHPRCEVCRSRGPVEVHHLSYARAGKGKEPDKDLLTLCRTHHQLAHTYEKSGRYGQPFRGATLRRATEAMLRDHARRAPTTGPGPARRWWRRQWLTLTGRKYP